MYILYIFYALLNFREGNHGEFLTALLRDHFTYHTFKVYHSAAFSNFTELCRQLDLLAWEETSSPSTNLPPRLHPQLQLSTNPPPVSEDLPVLDTSHMRQAVSRGSCPPATVFLRSVSAQRAPALPSFSWWNMHILCCALLFSHLCVRLNISL